MIERLGVIFLWWDADLSHHALKLLAVRLAELPVRVDAIHVVDNSGTASAALPVRRDRWPAFVVIPGDNHDYEFSGWSKGLRSAPSEPVWLLANDRFATASYPYLRSLDAGVVAWSRRRQALVGKLDAYPLPVASLSAVISPWVRTTFFLLPHGVFEAMGPLTTLHEPDLDQQLDLDRPESPLVRPINGLGVRHWDYLRSFLTHDGSTDYASTWYRALDLERDATEIRRKVRNILNEQLLSARAISAGAVLHDMRIVRVLAKTGPMASAASRLLAAADEDRTRSYLHRAQARAGAHLYGRASR